MNGNKQKVNIIVPVYGDWNSLKKNIESLQNDQIDLTNIDCKIWYVNDCGPDADYIEKKILNRIAGFDGWYYVRNDHNLGFVQNCNNAVNNLIDSHGEILLLNSDTKVTEGFLKEMLNVLNDDKSIAAISPRSNAATMFSVPTNSTVSARRSYHLYLKIRNKLARYYRSPVAHGFCMLLRRDVVNQLGLFDEVYGKGYGEETDFCMRAMKNGYISAVSNWAYVFHEGSKSFGKKHRNESVAEHEKILTSRYPDYHGLVYATAIAIRDTEAGLLA